MARGLDKQRIKFFADFERSDATSHRADFGTSERGQVEEGGDAERSFGEVDCFLGGEGRGGSSTDCLTSAPFRLEVAIE